MTVFTVRRTCDTVIIPAVLKLYRLSRKVLVRSKKVNVTFPPIFLMDVSGERFLQERHFWVFFERFVIGNCAATQT